MLTSDIIKIIREDNEDFEEIVAKYIVDVGRWDIYYEKVVKRLDDETFWKVSWTMGATEAQEMQDYDFTHAKRVYPKQVTQIIYE